MSVVTPANAVLIVHFLYVTVVVASVPLIIAGGLRRWAWVHNVWFRTIHVAMIGIVVGESLLGIRCPLTVWEGALRRTYAPTDFIAGFFDRLLFYNFPHWVFTAIYSCFGLLIIALFYFVPIRRTMRPVSATEHNPSR